MKIIHSSGKELKLNPGTVLEMERTNPFFNTYGEQSLPVKIPADAHNRAVLGFPDDLAGVKKMPARSDATLQEGIFYIRGRQAILSANEDEVDTSFYLNTGSFYEKMKDVSLATVFKNKVLKFDSIYAAMNFVRGLMVTPDLRFSCFPALVESHDTGRIVCLNKMVLPLKEDGYLSFYNEISRSEVVDDKTVSVPEGYYITPFIKANHLLEEIFKYLGYTMEENFFTRNEPFRSMVFLNNNMDTIVNNEIRYDQIVPDCNISSILDIYRNKFCCEFIPDEVHRTVKIELFNDVIDRSASRDLTKCLTSTLTTNHGKKFKQLKLTCEKGPVIVYNPESGYVSTTPDFLSKKLYEVKAAYPGALVSGAVGAIFREGYKCQYLTTEDVGSLNSDYYAGEEDLEDEEKKSPDVLVSVILLLEYGGYVPFLGTSRAINSSIIWGSSAESTNTEESTQSKSELKAMLCFTVHRASESDRGTIYDCFWGETLWDYALCYNGKNGLYERFWRKYDDLLRNSMRPVTGKLMLTDLDKMNISAYEKVLLQNQELLPNTYKYNIGKKESTECSFFTTKMYMPVTSAMSESERFKPSKYRWDIKTEATVSFDYDFFTCDETPVAFFPSLPTEAEYHKGGRYHQKVYSGRFYNSSGYHNGMLTVWLEPVLRET